MAGIFVQVFDPDRGARWRKLALLHRESGQRLSIGYFPRHRGTSNSRGEAFEEKRSLSRKQTSRLEAQPAIQSIALMAIRSLSSLVVRGMSFATMQVAQSFRRWRVGTLKKFCECLLA